MIDIETKLQIYRSMSIVYISDIINNIGLKRVYKDIDTNSNPEMRGFFRSLVQESINYMSDEGLKIKD